MATDFTILDGATVGGDQGQGVLIESIAFKFDTTKDGEDEAVAEITGVAKTVMVDRYNPTLGCKELPEEVPVTERVKFALGGGKSTDNKILVERLNRAFQINPPLEDNSELWVRFTEDGKDSVYKQLVGKRAYFSAKKNTAKSGESKDHYYFNLLAVAERQEAKMDKVKERMEKILAKKNAASSFTAD